MDMGFDDYIYIVRVFEDDEIYEYEFGNLDHAMELFQSEANASLIKYRDSQETILESKGVTVVQ